MYIVEGINELSKYTTVNCFDSDMSDRKNY